MDFCNRNNIDKVIVDEIQKYHIESIHNLISGTIKSDSLSELEDWKKFMKQSDFEESHLISALFKEVKNLNRSTEYKLGTTLLKPYYILKKIIRKARKFISQSE